MDRSRKGWKGESEQSLHKILKEGKSGEITGGMLKFYKLDSNWG